MTRVEMIEIAEQLSAEQLLDCLETSTLMALVSGSEELKNRGIMAKEVIKAELLHRLNG